MVRQRASEIRGYGCGNAASMGARGQVLKQTNVVPFPLTVRGMPAADPACSPTSYEFTEDELAALCRWFSAMKYAFPGTEGVMMVNHQEGYSAVGLYNRAGGAPNCLVAKHEASGSARFFWSTEFDPPRPIRRSVRDHRRPHSRDSSAAQRKGLARPDRVDGGLCIASDRDPTASRLSPTCAAALLQSTPETGD